MKQPTSKIYKGNRRKDFKSSGRWSCCSSRIMQMDLGKWQTHTKKRYIINFKRWGKNPISTCFYGIIISKPLKNNW
jgi:hypothetical protein